MAGELIRPGVDSSRQCSNCKRAASPRRSRCAVCIGSGARSKRRLGVCRQCGSKSEANRCQECLQKTRNEYRSRVTNGQCVYCKEPSTAGAFCFTHWLKNIGSPYKLRKSNGGLLMIRSLWEEQKGLCKVTGEVLIPGHNASLDHIIPTSKGGLSTRDNLRWVLLEINRAKSNMTHQQFVEMCRKVVAASDESTPLNKEISLRLVSGSN